MNAPDIAGERRPAPRLFLLGGLLLCWCLLAAPAPVAAHANLVRAEPAAGVAVPVAPAEVRIWFSEQPEARYSEIAVYDANRQRYDTGGTRPLPGDALALVVGVRELPEGIYSVVWKANSAVDGHTTTGSFAFAVGNLPPPPPTAADGADGGTEFAPPTPAEVAVRWLTLLAATAFAGALGLRVFVWIPALRRAGATGGALDRRVGRRLVLLAGAALLALFLATVAGLILQAAKVSGVPARRALDAALLGDFLFTTRTGAIWLVRLLLPPVAAMLLGPLLVEAARRGGPRAAGEQLPARRPPSAALHGATPLAPVLFGLALGVGYLLTIGLISHGAASPLWTPFTVAMDWLHLLATAVWVGGLVGLALTLPALRSPGGGGRPLLLLPLEIVSRFSNIALASVGVLAATGLYSAWLHVGSFDALLPTAYGRTLTVKLALVAGLVALGASNFLWVRPRLAAPVPGEAAATERAGAVVLRHFGRAVRLEVLLAAATLLAVAVLTGFVPAREALAQARGPKRVQTAQAGDLRLTLALSSLQPGDTTFDVLIRDRRGNPVTDAQRVALRIDHLEMTMGEAEAIAEPRGDGHYVATGPYLSMSGRWQSRVIVRRAGLEDVDATFELAIGSAANLAQAAAAPAPPRLPAITPVRRAGLLLLVAGALLTLFGVPLFRRGSGFGTLLLMLVPTAFVVGGYLVYTDTGPDRTRAVEPPNPILADAGSVSRGGALFAQNCLACHGPRARGDGPTSATLNPRPPDMSQPHTAAHSDGYLFNVITNGSPGSAMPAWGGQLNERERWDLVNYLRSLNPLTAGTAPAPAAQRGGAGQGTPSPARQPSPTPAGVVPVTTAVPASPAAGPGPLIYAFAGTLWALDPAGGDPTNLTPDLPPNTFAADPALSPDGATLAHTRIVTPPSAGVGTPRTAALPGTDLYLMNVSGGGARLLLAHDRPGALVERPAWTPDGRALVYAYSAPVQGPDGRYTGSIRELQRLDLATGERTSLVKEAEDPALAPAPAGAASPPLLAYVLTEQRTFKQALWVAGADGRDGRKLLETDPTAENTFTAFSAPRFSPDGRRLVFAAVGGPGVVPPPPARPGGGLPGRLARWLLEPVVPRKVAAHGPPWDIWTVALDGGDLRRLTELYEDDPSPAWSPDGSRVAFLAGGGLYITGADGRGLVKISERGSYSALVWAPAPIASPATPAPPVAASPTALSADEGRSQRRALGDLVVALQVEPRVFQPTAVELRLTDWAGRPATDIQRVDLQVAMAGMNHGARGIAADPAGGGVYRARAMLVVMEGPWWLAVRVERAGGRLESGAFAFQAPPDPATTVAGAYYTRPDGPTQVVDVAVYPDAVTPGRIPVVAGRPVRLEVFYVDRPSCGTVVRFDERNLRAGVTPEGLAELSFVPDRGGQLQLSCTPGGLLLQFADAAGAPYPAGRAPDPPGTIALIPRGRSAARASGASVGSW